jgi:hypothetical protein
LYVNEDLLTLSPPLKAAFAIRSDGMSENVSLVGKETQCPVFAG